MSVHVSTHMSVHMSLQAGKVPQAADAVQKHALHAHFWCMSGIDERRRDLLPQVIEYMSGEYSTMLKLEKKVAITI